MLLCVAKINSPSRFFTCYLYILVRRRKRLHKNFFSEGGKTPTLPPLRKKSRRSDVSIPLDAEGNAERSPIGVAPVDPLSLVEGV